MIYHSNSDDPKISVIFPHLHTPINDKCLELALDAYEKNTHHTYELIIPDEKGDPYALWNKHIDKCKSDITIFSNTDCIPSKDWDKPYVKHYHPNKILTQVLVEPGAMGVAQENTHRNFGRCPLCFKRGQFEAYAAQETKNKDTLLGRGGWPMPSCMPKSMFLKHGKFKLTTPFMVSPIDLQFWDHVKKQGVEIWRVNSVWYHFQNLSRRANRCDCYQQASTRPS